ncbi:hypothetical protein CGRA01v4_00384 [Colletotrichum graminicola]|nr:hypothetical protein CGRA01v4_00384 [Colletotrichum graminicola]
MDRVAQKPVGGVSIRSSAQVMAKSRAMQPVATDFGELRMYMAPSNVGGIRVKHDCSTAGLDLLAVARNARALVENHDNGARA